MILPGLWKLSMNKQQQKPGTVVCGASPVVLNLWVATPHANLFPKYLQFIVEVRRRNYSYEIATKMILLLGITTT